MLDHINHITYTLNLYNFVLHNTNFEYLGSVGWVLWNISGIDIKTTYVQYHMLAEAIRKNIRHEIKLCKYKFESHF